MDKKYLEIMAQAKKIREATDQLKRELKQIDDEFLVKEAERIINDKS